MDSLTQIILGAAVGEAALGKKVGNRAMVWGGIAGTIPDLDVLSNFFISKIDSLAFHRGITHSFVFSVILALLLGWLVHRMYMMPWHKWLGIAGWGLLLTTISGSIIFFGEIKLLKSLAGLGFLAGFGWLMYKRYFRTGYSSPDAGIMQWQWMFFLSLVTHPILDCFTTFGTQFLLPFSDRRIAFNNIAVADPIYTIPFLICLLTALFLPASDNRRRKWNNLGLVISSIYMVFTIYNKTRINTIFENSLSHEGITYSRYITTPTILNNVLWNGIAEADSAYYYGQFSFFDKDKKFKIKKIEKTASEFKNSLQHDATLKTLGWFSNEYYVMKRGNGDTLQYFDLRFGTFRVKPEDPESFVFKFNLLEKPTGVFTLIEQGESPRDANLSEVFKVLWNRILGKTG